MTKEVKELRKKRKALGVTQAQLAKAAHVNPSTLAGIEAGYGVLNADVARRLWDALAKVECERQSDISVTERQLRNRIAELENENTAYRGVEAAKSNMQLCSALPWMRQQLPEARARLARRLAELERLQSQPNLDDPIMKGLLDSLYKEKEELAAQITEMESVTVPVTEAIHGLATLQFCDAVQNGERWAVDIFERWKATGECALTLNIDSIEKE